MAIYFGARMPKKHKVAAGLFVVVAFLALLVPSPFSKRFTSSFNLKEGSNAGRIEMWEKAYGVTLDHPLLGVGIGNFPLEVKASADYREPIYAHNSYLDVASEMGIFALGAWLAIIISLVVGFLAKARKDVIFLFLAGSVVIYAVHSLVETAIYSPVNLALFLIIAGFITVKTKTSEAY